MGCKNGRCRNKTATLYQNDEIQTTHDAHKGEPTASANQPCIQKYPAGAALPVRQGNGPYTFILSLPCCSRPSLRAATTVIATSKRLL